jgi:hypothetical protein
MDQFMRAGFGVLQVICGMACGTVRFCADIIVLTWFFQNGWRKVHPPQWDSVLNYFSVCPLKKWIDLGRKVGSAENAKKNFISQAAEGSLCT